MSDVIKVSSVGKMYKSSQEYSNFSTWLRGVVKPKYNYHAALDSVDFVVKEGSSVGLVGANGAGKSSLIKILCGIQRPSSGGVEVLGYEPGARKLEYLRNIGAVFGHKTSLWWDLPVRTSFLTYKKIYGVDDEVFFENLSELSAALSLDHVLSRSVRNLSLGERVKCELALNFLHNPRLIFLDEPTLGLDVTSRYEIREYINRKRKAGKLTVFMTSHDFGDIESCCDTLIVLNKGRIEFKGRLSEFLSTFSDYVGLEVRCQRGLFSASDEALLERAVLKHQLFCCENLDWRKTLVVSRAVVTSLMDGLKANDDMILEVSSLSFENSMRFLFERF
ncbi:ATP-binding cassette domain-containing protein [Pseudomonas sp. R5(2019)]|uniref:ATP-binding cassette domain-containing protein n=1 Tax=Pseudomonas sp. R5(2019) TaxID=2697566 RepID=UPI001412742C|nr:ATP-binding cassette domain-containing protein [Pseudomonas sp. R5(2019)]